MSRAGEPRSAQFIMKYGEHKEMALSRSKNGKKVAVIFIACAFLCALIILPPTLGATPHSSPGPEIVAYVFPQNRVLQPGDIAAQKLTRINYAFANLQDGRIVNGFKNDDQNFQTLVALKHENPSLTVLVSVGGWTWSGNFSDMALTRRSRERFIQSVVEFIEHNQLDGLDIDWEYPGLPGDGNRFRPQDKQNYTRLLKGLRKRFNREGKKLHRHLYLTIATGASPKFVAHTQMGKVQKYVDAVNLMAYDYYEPGSDPITGNNAPLFTDPMDPKKLSADASVRLYEQAGVPARKIVLGIPFYGHVWADVGDANHGLFQSGKPALRGFWRQGGFKSLFDGGFTRYWDSSAAVPFLYNSEKKMFVSYEDPESIAGKCKYVLDHHLAGIMFWAYSNNPMAMRLLDAVNAGLRGSPEVAGSAGK